MANFSQGGGYILRNLNVTIPQLNSLLSVDASGNITTKNG